MAERDNSAAVGAMMLVAGGVIGAGLALLFAPQSGRKTRRRIARYGRKVRNEAEEMARETTRTVSEMVEDLGERTSEMMDHGSEVAEGWRRQLLESLERGQKGLEKQRRRLTQLWE